jgi:hypothetical protein
MRVLVSSWFARADIYRGMFLQDHGAIKDSRTGIAA